MDFLKKQKSENKIISFLTINKCLRPTSHICATPSKFLSSNNILDTSIKYKSSTNNLNISKQSNNNFPVQRNNSVSVDKSSVFRKLYINNQNKPLNIFTLSNLIPTMHFWNNLHQVSSNSKDWKVK